MNKISFIILIFWLQPTFALTVEEGSFESGLGHQLEFVLGLPKNPENLFVNIEGDGHGCGKYNVENIKKLARQISFKDAWVLPETSRQLLCGSGQYKSLDFHHRITEIKNLVELLRTDSRLKNLKLYLMGSSGGVDLVSHTLKVIKDVAGVVLIAGASGNLETAFYNKELIDGYRSGLSDEQIRTKIDSRKNLFTRIKSNCSTTAFDWGDRNNLFWCQMFSSDIVGNILNSAFSTRILVIHGQLDDVVPVEEAYSSVAKLIANNRDVTSVVNPKMGHKMYPFLNDVLKSIDSWLK